ncbi:hypothetical protein [Yinghuangia seranimata]|uniref:hypothetical protein n=1 Tax=Yinghuangia seranimata TaxID=408067 RepID=UPI00248ADD9E|nr:hypothetical protein [Yinghuangia seranimata]MDI2127620.1 hypothetical protein [Yinghuangia seranimata]
MRATTDAFTPTRRFRRLRTLAASSAVAGALLVSALPGAAGATAGRSAQPATLPAGCWGAGYFCGSQDNSSPPNNYGCGWHDITMTGPGWWVNNLNQGTKRVKMYNYDYTRVIYTTPAAPYSDWTADWTQVYHIYAC